MPHLRVRLETLAPMWTGGVEMRGGFRRQVDRLHETGLLGSLRWWYEALVRGLGGSACDPTSDHDRCPDRHGHHCVACDLFGCTGWARKFRLRPLDVHGRLVVERLERVGTMVQLDFLPLRDMGEEETWLLARAIQIAARHGAMGGKTTLKPQDRPIVGDDYGLLRWIDAQGAPEAPSAKIAAYVHEPRWRLAETHLPDLRWFFFVHGTFLWREQINTLIGLSQDGRRIIGRQEHQEFLRGRLGTASEPAVSKKVFSFRADEGRIWGYARDGAMRDTILGEISRQRSGVPYRALTGEQVLAEEVLHESQV